MGRTIANIALYQIAWFALVVGAAQGQSLLGAVFAVGTIAIHVGTAARPWVELRRGGIALLLGLGVEASLVGTQTYAAVSGPPFALWMLILWFSFALSFERSMAWTSRRPFLGAGLGAIFGPLAYIGGAKLGAITLSTSVSSIALISILWALAMVVLSAARAREDAVPVQMSRVVPALPSIAMIFAVLSSVPALAAERAFGARCAFDGTTEVPIRGQSTYKFIGLFEVFHAALYLPVAAEDPLTPIAKCLELEYARSFSAEQFQDVTKKGIKANVDGPTYQKLAPSIDAYNRLYRDVEEGDRYRLRYVPGSGTHLDLNGVERGVIPGEEFAKALFSIWLGKESMSDDLKQELLRR